MPKENDNSFKSRIALKYTVDKGQFQSIYDAVKSRVLNGMLAGADTLILEKESEDIWNVTTYIEGEEVWTEDIKGERMGGNGIEPEVPDQDQTETADGKEAESPKPDDKKTDGENK